MNFETQNIINAAMDLPVIIMMLALFSAGCLVAGKKKHQKLLIGIMAVDIFALASDLTLWLLLGDSENIRAIKIMWTASYILSYILIILFHYYLLAHISDRINLPKWLYFVVIPLALLFSALYLSSFKTGLFFTISETGEFIGGELSNVGRLIRLSVILLDIVITLIYSVMLGVGGTFRFLFYESVPIAAQFIDSKYRLGLVYIFVSVLILIDYISFSVRRDMLYAKQKETMALQEEKLTEQKTKIMISQIQPHFLYNVISSIMSLCKEDSDKAVDALADFAGYLRTNMRSLSLDKPVLFEKELEHIKTYIKLEKIRFLDRLEVEYDIKVSDFYLPSLSLQPIVENAVKHGIGQRPEGGKIVISTELCDKGVLVTVKDNGVGFDTSKPHGEDGTDHVGLENARERISSMCKGILDIQSTKGEGTTVTILLPNYGQM